MSSQVMQDNESPIAWSDLPDYRETFGCFPTGVTIVTSVTHSGQPVGMTVNSFTSVSMQPPMILWSIRSESKLRDVFWNASHFAVHILAHNQIDLSNRFCSPMEDRFDGLGYESGEGGIPLLRGCSAVIECRSHEIITWGDHDVLCGLILRHARSGKAPLAFAAGSYGRFVKADGAS